MNYANRCLVNGKDTHDEAGEPFLMARDLAEIEVQHRVATAKTSSTLPSGTKGVDAGTQTEITLGAMVNFVSSATTLGMTVMDKYKQRAAESEIPSYGSLYPTGFFEDMPKHPGRGELEYEEVDLERVTSQDKLGLTLCYKTDEEEETGIYVSEIDPKSIAAKDGRVREGDRIIQINGVDIQNHKEAVAVLSKENNRNVRLLLARPDIQDDGWLEEDKHGFLDDLHMGMMEQQHCQAVQFTASALQQRGHEGDGGTVDLATVLPAPCDKDSGVGCTDESTRNDENSELENLCEDHTSTSDAFPSADTRLSYGRGILGSRRSSESFLSAEGGDFSSIPETECEHFRELLKLKCVVDEDSPFVILGESSARSVGNRISLDCDEQEIQMLNEELRKIELECLSIIRSHRLQQEIQAQQLSRGSKDQQGCSHKTSTAEGQARYSVTTGTLEQADKDSSSAYNTGESCRSSSVTLELSSDIEGSRGTQNGVGGAVAHRNKPAAEPCTHTLSPIEETSPKKNYPDAPQQGKGQEQGNKHLKKSCLASPPLPPYKHIPAHAQHYQSYMQLVQQKSAVEYGQSDVSLVGLCQNPESFSVDSKPKMEWKVKMRSDGTRYITKRPAREQLLRERALRIREERRGMTTDDDAASELKMGRYWSKEERKQQASRAKELRQRRELMKQSRVACTSEQEGRAEDIIQLSHRKMMKKRNKKILDSWMTIQELLTHGTKSLDGTRLYNPLLSVTTV